MKAFVIVSDNNEHVELVVKCSIEAAIAIRGLIKLPVAPVRRGYWGIQLRKPHTVPCKVTGKVVTIRKIPTPRGSGIVAARVPKKVWQFSRICDVFTSSKGSMKTLDNFVIATSDRLLKIYRFLTPTSGRRPSSQNPRLKSSHKPSGYQECGSYWERG